MSPKQIGISIAVGAGLLVVGSVAWAISQAVAALIADHTTIFGMLALSTTVVLLIGGARIVFAFGAQQRARAWQAELTHLQNGMPIHVRDVPELAEQLAHTTLDQHYAVEYMRAGVSPTLTHYHNETHPIASPELLGNLLSISPPPAPALPAITSGSGPQLAQLQQIGHVCRSGNSLLVGYADGQPQYIELAECGFIGIGGQPRVGKSVTASLLIDQAVLSGWHVLIGDPHIQKTDGLLNRLRPLSGRLARQAVTPEEIAQMVRLADKIGKRRVAGDPDRTPVILVIDEFSNLVWRELLPDDVLAILPSMAAEYAGVGVHGVLIAHDWSKASLGGDLGAALRRAFTHRIIHRMDPGNVEFLLPRGSSAQARAVQGLDKGRALYAGPDGTVTVTVPLVGDDDAAYAAQDAPPAPHAAARPDCRRASRAALRADRPHRARGRAAGPRRAAHRAAA
ncbi:hypothetical protein [Kouleothrix sp.]|uniref:hypothetical protein n=1 Tax=Kouleothrix sp. TaxID=2779161 RepID=UPI003918FDA8